MTQESESEMSGLSDSERLQLFISGINDYAIYMLSPEGIVRSWNAGAQRFKGYSSEDIIGEHFSRFYTPEDREAGLPARGLLTAKQEGKFEAEGLRVRKDGSRFWASVVIDAIRDSGGNLIGFAKITRDIDERRRAQAALQATQEGFQLLVQGVTDYAIYMLSASGEITNWNSGAERIKGYQGEEVVGTHFSRFYTAPDLAAGLPARALSTAREAGRFEGEGYRVRRDGTQFWAHVVIDAIHNPAGELLGFAKITRDITERRDAALALEKAKEALFQAQKLDAIGRLTGGVAHDFNNLLSVIVSGLEILSTQVKSSSGRKTVASMQRAATHGATLTRQLLSFARQQPLRQDKYDLNGLVTSFRPLLLRARHDSVNLVLELGRGLDPVMIDAVQFEAALLNLVTNANDAMPAGGTLVIRTENVALSEFQVGELPAGNYVRVTLRDDGIGMAPDVAARAIEPFFTTKEIGKGSGMGLSQVCGLVQQSGGDLTVASGLGEGTTVSLYLPALPDSDVNELTPEPVGAVENVIVLADQEDVMASATQVFKLMGYEVITAPSQQHALDLLRPASNIKVLMADMALPGLDSVSLGLKARQRIPGIRVVLVSGPGVSRGQAAANRGVAVVRMPLRIAEIARALRLPLDVSS